MKAKGFTELAVPEIEDTYGDECGWRCDYCDELAFEYHGAWIESSGEFGDDRLQVECTGCGETAELK
jgi:hypothetical protein